MAIHHANVKMATASNGGDCGVKLERLSVAILRRKLEHFSFFSPYRPWPRMPPPQSGTLIIVNSYGDAVLRSNTSHMPAAQRDI